MKIISLTAENVKRLRAIEIRPDETMQVISGRNAQGKTSVLDAIWLALGGGAAARETPRPIRDGEDKASVTLDLGDLKVTRVWKGDKTTLTVCAADGAKYSSPQGVLDALVGRLSFDPLAFTRLSAREQRETLLDLVHLDVDLTLVDRQRRQAFTDRTDVGRHVKALGNIPTPAPGVGETEISASALIDQISAAGAAVEKQRQADAWVETALARVQRIENELAAARQDLDAAELAQVNSHQDLPDVAELRRELAQVEETNRCVRDNATIRARIAERDRLQEEYDSHTEHIAALDQMKAEALAAAEFPVEGLGFDDEGVTYQGVPFSQASSAEQIRVSIAMAMSLNPKLRVIRILDGSLLDSDSLALIGEMAASHDYQIWVERVADGSDMGVVIEDGAVSA